MVQALSRSVSQYHEPAHLTRSIRSDPMASAAKLDEYFTHSQIRSLIRRDSTYGIVIKHE